MGIPINLTKPSIKV